MLDRRAKAAVSTVLSSLFVVALIFNAVARPVHASTPSSLFSDPCPNSLLAVGKQSVNDVLAQFESVLENDPSSAELGAGTDEEGHVDQEPEDQVRAAIVSHSSTEDSRDNLGQEDEGIAESQTSRRGDVQSTAASSVEEAREDAQVVTSNDPEEGSGTWGKVGNAWRQIRQLRLEMPDLSLGEAREALDQILSLRNKVPGVSFGEAREVWSQIRELQLEIPDLSFDQAHEVWDQITEVRVEMPDLNFAEARKVWHQIRGLQIAIPDLSFGEAKEVWDEIGELRVECLT